jgi:hypothetical protein
MAYPDEIKVTTEVLLKGALLFALTDIVFVTVLTRLIKPFDLRKMKWSLAVVMAVFFCALFGALLSVVFWVSVYRYVFPPWARWIVPPAYGLLFSAAGLFFRWLALRSPPNAVRNFLLFGGLWGIITHVLAIHRGILDKPPMLHGANPSAALAIAAFEFVFYWCVCLSLAFGYYRVTTRPSH